MKDIRYELKEQDKKFLFGDERKTIRKYDITSHILWLKFTRQTQNENGETKIESVKVVPIALNNSQGSQTQFKDITTGKIYEIDGKIDYKKLASDLKCDGYLVQELTLPKLMLQIRILSLAEAGVSAFDQTRLTIQKTKISELLKKEKINSTQTMPRMVLSEKIEEISNAFTDFFNLEARIEPRETQTKKNNSKTAALY